MYWSIISGFAFAMAGTWLSIPFIIKLAERYGWMDKPDHRKVHYAPIPPLGGLAIFCSFWLVFLVIGQTLESAEMISLFLASLILFFVSLKDDLKALSPIIRLLTHISIAAICFSGGLMLTGFYGLFGLGMVASWAQFILTVLAIVTIINAFNLIDGINGLAGSLSLIAFLFFFVLFFQAGLYSWSLLSLTMAGSILGFLKFNFGKASIFMGDNGSTFLGLLLATCFIKYLSIDNGVAGDYNHLITGLSVLCLPVLDLARVSIIRLFQGKSPFSADRSHIHHLLLAQGKSHQTATMQIAILQIVLIICVQQLLPVFSPLVIFSIGFMIFNLFVLGVKMSITFTEIKGMERRRLQVGIPDLPKPEES